MKNKIILKKKTLEELEMKRMPRRLKKIHKKIVGAGEVFAEIFSKEENQEAIETMPLGAHWFASGLIYAYKQNL